MKNPIAPALAPALPAPPVSSRPATRSLPAPLRRAIECLGGYDLRDVRVHYDSPAPARVGARAFACGSAIHLGPGAESALAHEAWHVVQQKQGRTPATSLLDGAALNDDPRLEAEADLMGALALRLCHTPYQAREQHPRQRLRRHSVAAPVLQRAVKIKDVLYPCGQTGKETTFEDLSKYVVKALNAKLGEKAIELFPASVMAEILVDFVQDDAAFADDAALLAEIAIRNVGYQAETAMRQLMDSNNRTMLKQQYDTGKLLEKAKAQWIQDQPLALSERHYKTETEYNDDVNDITETGAQGFLQWGRASYFTSTTNTPLARWVLGATSELPLWLNCWETTLFSLVKAGLASKDYMIWANMTPTMAPPDWKADGVTSPTPNFQRAMPLIRDYYWSVADGPLKDQSDRMRQKTDWQDTGSVCIPPDFKIPRGRLVILNFCSHVALSTGRPYLIADESAQEFFGTRMGHGILELDGADGSTGPMRTIRETTIEDLQVSMGSTYLKHIIIAPYPSINNSYSKVIESVEKITSLSSVKEAVQQFLDQNIEQITMDRARQEQRDKDAIRRTQNAIDKLVKTSPGYDTSLARLSKQKTAQETAAKNAQIKITDDWNRLAMKSDEVQIILKRYKRKKKDLDSVLLPTTFAFSAIDLYHGLVQLPAKT